MALRVGWVRYGRPAAEALRGAIAATKGDVPLAPVNVVVPSNHVGVATRRLLASGTLGPLCSRGAGLVAVTFLTIYRMAELLGAASLAAQGRRPVSTPVIAAALRSALARDPGIFAPVAEHPATEMALVAAYKELRDVSPEAQRRLAARGDRVADVVRLYRVARAHLEARFYDEEDLMGAAVEVLDVADRPGGGLDAPVVVYLPQHLSRHGASLLRALAQRCEVLVLAGTTGDRRADAEVARSLHRLDGSTLVPPAPTLVPPVPAGLDPLAMVAVGRTQIVTTSDADEEVRAAVRAVVDSARAGTPLERIAILYATPEPYARSVYEQLSAAGIAHNGVAVVPLTARLAGRTLLELLALPRARFRRDDVFSWLSGTRLRRGNRLLPVTAWERVSREAGVVAGREQWDRLLATCGNDREAQAAVSESDPGTPAWRAERLRNDAARARELREFVLGLIDTLEEAASSPRPWAWQAAWARRHLDDLLGTERRRAGWPATEQKAAERVERAIDRLGALGAIEGAVPLDVFVHTLELELRADPGRVGRMGEGVLVGSLHTGVGLELDLLVVLGLAEGSLPAPVGDDSLLPDHERESAGDELALRAHDVERQHHELLAALAGGERHVLCVPRGDLRRSSDRVPSRWVLDIARSLEGGSLSSEELLGARRPWLTHVASYDDGLRQLAFPATAQEHRLRALLAHRPARPLRATLQSVGDPVLSAGAEVVAARRGDRFTRFDGNLAGLPVRSPTERATSATRLEGWARCPFAYFAREVLGVEEVENPEDALSISPRDLGSLVHEVLEQFIGDVLARPPDRRPAPTEPWTESDRAHLLRIAETVCERYEARGLVGRRIFWYRDRRRAVADLERFLAADSDRRVARGTRPVAAELAFGLPGAKLPTVALALPDGRTVELRGKADRLDVADSGVVEVLDYKTGSAREYRELDENNPDARGTRLQLAVYGLAARLHQGASDLPVRAEYWFITSRCGFQPIGYMVTPEVLDRVSRAVSRVVSGIERGVFPNHPVPGSAVPSVECPYCDPDALGVADLRRQTERKRADPALSVFLELAEPQLAEPQLVVGPAEPQLAEPQLVVGPAEPQLAAGAAERSECQEASGA